MSPRPHRAALAPCVLLLAAATGCGSTNGEADEPSSASDSSSSASTTPSASTGPTSQTLSVGDTVGSGQALIVSASNVDAPMTRLASALVNDQAVDTFVGDIDPGLADDVRAAVKAAQVPDGSTLFGSVVSVGCHTPTAVLWEQTFDGIEATAQLPKSDVQCLVPVTSVALFLVADPV